MASAQPGDLVLLQADAIDETMQWLRGYLAAKHPEESLEAIAATLEESAAIDDETLHHAEMNSEALANAPTIAKV
jgi:hypothetical protein